MERTLKQLTLFNPNLMSYFVCLFFITFVVRAEGDKKCIGISELEKFSLKKVLNADDIFVKKGGGEVYSFDGFKCLSRIDKSFDFQTRFGALNFIYDDSLYSFGGYGIFQFSNSIISFDKESGKWKLHFPDTSYDAPAARRFMIGGVNNSDLIIGPGTSEKYNNKTSEISSHLSKDFWMFNLKSKKWTKLIDEKTLDISNNSRLFNLGDISIISGHKLMLIDYSLREIKIADNSKKDIFHNAVRVKYKNHELTIISLKDTLILPLQSLLTDEIETVKLEPSIKDDNLHLLVATVVSVIIFLIYFYKKSKGDWQSNLSREQLMIIRRLEVSNESILYKELYDLYEIGINYDTLKGKLRRDILKIEEAYFKKHKKHYFSQTEDPSDRRLKRIQVIKQRK